jgi:hypothetical protein
LPNLLCLEEVMKGIKNLFHDAAPFLFTTIKSNFHANKGRPEESYKNV